MNNSFLEHRTALLEKIPDGIRKSDQHTSGLKQKNFRYIAVSIIASYPEIIL